jgi:hypothetical protein
MNIKFLAILFFSVFTINAQETEFSGSVNTKGIFYSNEQSPFWIHSNQRGRVDELTHIAGWANASAVYYLADNARLTFGAGVLFQDGYSDKFQLDESFISFQNSWLEITAGRKQMQELYNGLSASNCNIAWSLNARPLPGLEVSTTRPVFLFGDRGIGFEASLAEFFMGEERFVKNARVHHKSFHLVYKASGKFQFKAGLQHYVQWAGVHPDFGKLPNTFKDYLSVFIGTEGSDDVSGEEANALGNHLGVYEVGLKTVINKYEIELIYNHLFEDGSGRNLGNTPDGRYGLFIQDKEQGKLLEAFMYEFYYTKNQSSNSPTTDGIDNYFNNNLYRSGWTYEKRILGVPFITLDDQRFRISNNKILVHHIGVAGTAFNALPYQILTSYRKNYGGKGSGETRSNVLSAYLNFGFYTEFADVSLQLGSDFSSVASPNFGAGIQISKKLF